MKTSKRNFAAIDLKKHWRLRPDNLSSHRILMAKVMTQSILVTPNNTSMAAESLWTQCLEYLSYRIPESAFNTWFSSIRAISYSSDKVVLGLPNNFVLEYVTHHYRKPIEDGMAAVLGLRIEVEFTALPGAAILELYEAESEVNNSSDSSDNVSARSQVVVDVSTPLNDKYSFNSFVIGDCNQLAHAACMAVAQAPHKNNFNPLVIYGGTGMGKTHLLQAIAHFCLENETVRKIVYRSSEEFTREYIEYVQKIKDSRTFYQVYNDADVLLIDDIQFLAGKHSTQDEFFNIFSVLQSLHKQIVITSDRPPSAIKGLHSRLLSRFDTGLIADLQPPNMETRLAIVQKKNEGSAYSFLTDEVLYYVANHVTSNVRELEGTLIKLSAYASFYNLPISVEIAKQILGDTVRNVDRPITINRIIDSVAGEFSTTNTLLTSQTRKKNVAEPRQVAMHLARKLTDNSLHTIGLAFGRDYSTVIHSLKKMESLLETDDLLRDRVDRIQRSLV